MRHSPIITAAVTAVVLALTVGSILPAQGEAGRYEGGNTVPVLRHQVPMVRGIAHSPEDPGGQIPTGEAPHWMLALGFYLAIGFAVLGLSFAEWRWMITRQKHLKALVLERTRELEADKTELLQAKAALVELASHDFLTGVFNRAAIMDLLEQQIKWARRERSSFAVVLTDLDNFKRVNDTYGHLAGDAVVRDFAQRIQTNLRPGDHVGRFGGEELLILVRGRADESGERIKDLHRQATAEPFVLGDLVLRVTCSFGVAWFPSPLNTIDSLLSLADEALYAAKANGRNRVEVAERLSISRPTDFERGASPRHVRTSQEPNTTECRIAPRSSDG